MKHLRLIGCNQLIFDAFGVLRNHFFNCLRKSINWAKSVPKTNLISRAGRQFNRLSRLLLPFTPKISSVILFTFSQDLISNSPHYLP